MNRGIATFTLDNGHCPPWLFERMVKLGRVMTHALVEEFGPEEFVRRIGDPVWFQSLGTVLAFDWNASGLTTILTAALKEAIRGEERDLGIFICGGKGKTSLKTPDEIHRWGDRLGLADGMVHDLTYNSKMAAKVDSSLVQDGFAIYHHSFFFSRSGAWTVVQQGMNKQSVTARRYHWHSAQVKDIVCEPHSGIISDTRTRALNLAAQGSDAARTTSVGLVEQGYRSLMRDIEVIRRHSSRTSQMISMKSRPFDAAQGKQGELFTAVALAPIEFKHHPVEGETFWKSRYLEKILARVTDEKPDDYESLLAMKGVGPKTVRALALVGEVLYGASPSYEDPARYSFAFGGKDATPYPVDRRTYDETIRILGQGIRRARINPMDKQKMLGRLGGPVIPRGA